MNPIDFGGQRSKVKVTMDIYGNKLVDMIETKPLCISLSNLADMLIMVNPIDLEVTVQGWRSRWVSLTNVGCAGMLRFALLYYCWCFCDLDFVHSNFKVIQYFRLTIAFKLVLNQSSQILLPLCNPAIPSLAVSCFLFQKTNFGLTKNQKNHEIKCQRNRCWTRNHEILNPWK